MIVPASFLPGEAAFSGACTLISTACAVFVAWRDARWRKNGMAKALEERIDAANDKADRWHETDKAKAILGELERQGDELIKLDGAVKNAATKEELARLQGAVNQAAQSAGKAAAGVDRIEALLLKKALDA